MEAFIMSKCIYFQIIWEINSFITWPKGGLTVRLKGVFKGDFKVF